MIFFKTKKALEKLESKTKIGSLRNQQIRTLQQKLIFSERLNDLTTAKEVSKQTEALRKNKKSAGWHNKFFGKR